MKSWYSYALTETSRESAQKCIFLVVGTKVDDQLHREVPAERASQWARNIAAEYIEVSSKTGTNLSSIFDLVYLKLKLASTGAGA